MGIFDVTQQLEMKTSLSTKSGNTVCTIAVFACSGGVNQQPLPGDKRDVHQQGLLEQVNQVPVTLSIT